jgi:hypothetical protein
VDISKRFAANHAVEVAYRDVLVVDIDGLKKLASSK